MKTANREPLECFQKEVKALLLCPEEEKDRLLFGLWSDIEEYLEDHPDATLEELKAHFGQPEDVANSYQFSIGGEEVRKRIKKKKQLWYVLAIAIGVVFMAGLILLIVFVTKATDDLPEYQIYHEYSTEEISSIASESLNTNAVTV